MIPARIRAVLFSPATAAAIRGIAGHKQPAMAPVALGGAVITGLASILIGGYRITDCLRFQSDSGQCEQVIEDNVMTVLGGAAAVAGSWGGFNTLNPKLHGGDAAAVLPPKELVHDQPRDALGRFISREDAARISVDEAIAAYSERPDAP